MSEQDGTASSVSIMPVLGFAVGSDREGGSGVDVMGLCAVQSASQFLSGLSTLLFFVLGGLLSLFLFCGAGLPSSTFTST